jgi:putative heme-binding domain-containing protein
LTPNAAVESGYRLLLVETRAGERLDGFLASSDDGSIVLRRQGREDLRLERTELASSAFDRISVMPEGLLDGLSDAEIAGLFGYLLSLR